VILSAEELYLPMSGAIKKAHLSIHLQYHPHGVYKIEDLSALLIGNEPLQISEHIQLQIPPNKQHCHAYYFSTKILNR